MRWRISKNSEVPVRDQLIAQVFLGIISNDLKPDEKLPSTRELARRFHLHPNTVRAAYRDLARRGWLEFRKGSGVYVRALNLTAPLDKSLSLDQLISIFLRTARDSGHSLSEIQSRVKSWLDLQPYDRFLVIESDRQLRKILVAEIEQATGFPTTGASLEECANTDLLMGAAPVALRGQAEKVRALLPPDTGFTVLYLRSVTDWLESGEPVPQEILITVCSGWTDLLTNARSILVAAGVDPDRLILRDATGKGWQKMIPKESYVITDALTATRMPEGFRGRVFQVIADSSIAELINHKKFLTGSDA